MLPIAATNPWPTLDPASMMPTYDANPVYLRTSRLTADLHEVAHDERPYGLVLISQVLNGHPKPRVRKRQHLLFGPRRGEQSSGGGGKQDRNKSAVAVAVAVGRGIATKYIGKGPHSWSNKYDRGRQALSLNSDREDRNHANFWGFFRSRGVFLRFVSTKRQRSTSDM